METTNNKAEAIPPLSNVEVRARAAITEEAEPPEKNDFSFVRQTVKQYAELPSPLSSVSDVECFFDEVSNMPYEQEASPLTKAAVDMFNNNKHLPKTLKTKANRRLFEKLARSQPTNHRSNDQRTDHPTNAKLNAKASPTEQRKNESTGEQQLPGILQSYDDYAFAAKVKPSLYSIHSTYGSAVDALGPSFFKCTTRNSVHWFECKSCKAKVKLTVLERPGSGTKCYAVAYEKKCTHPLYTWRSFLLKEDGQSGKGDTKGRGGLPPLVKEKCDEVIAQYPSITSQMCYHKVHLALVENDECFRSQEVRNILRTKIMRYRRSRRRTLNNQTAIQTSQDIYMYRFTLDLLSRLPDWWQAECVLSEEHMYEIGKRLADSGVIGLKPTETVHDTTRTSYLFTLEVPPDYSKKECVEHTRIEELQAEREKQGKPPVTRNSVVFSSLNLLRTICDVANPRVMGTPATKMKAEDLMVKIVVAADASHDFTHSGFKLVSLGVVNYARVLSAASKSYKKTYNPLILMLCPSECEESYLVLFRAVKYAVLKLFGVKRLDFATLLQDCSMGLLNAVKISFPLTATDTCYSHVIRKHLVGRKGNGSYAKYLRHHGITYLKEIVARDVQLVHRCRTEAQAAKMAEIVIAGWKQAGEDKLAQVFADSYVNNPPFNRWWYSCVGMKGQSPHTNALERIHLEAKGCSLWEGMVQTNISIEQCLHREMPKLVYGWSRDRTGMNFEFKILDKKMILQSQSNDSYQLFQYATQLDWEHDVYEEQRPHSASNTEQQEDGNNTVRFYFSTTAGSKNANALNVARRNSAMEGKFDGGYSKRDDFIALTEALCCVEREQTPSGQWCWMGDCAHFWKTTFCVHAACKQYETNVRDGSYKLPTRKIKYDPAAAAAQKTKKAEKTRRLKRRNETQTNRGNHGGGADRNNVNGAADPVVRPSIHGRQRIMAQPQVVMPQVVLQQHQQATMLRQQQRAMVVQQQQAMVIRQHQHRVLMQAMMQQNHQRNQYQQRAALMPNQHRLPRGSNYEVTREDERRGAQLADTTDARRAFEAELQRRGHEGRKNDTNNNNGSGCV